MNTPKRWVKTTHAVGDDHFKKGESITIAPTADVEELLRLLREAPGPDTLVSVRFDWLERRSYFVVRLEGETE